MYVMNCKSEKENLSDNLNNKTKFEICLQNSIIGVSSESDTDTLNVFRRVQKGDYIWLHTDGGYYIAHVTGTITTADERYKEYDIEYYIKCKYYSVGAEIPSEISFCKDMLFAPLVIKEIEYYKGLFEFTKEFVSKNNKKTRIPRAKEFFKRNKKKFLIIFIALLGVIAIFFSVKCVQYIQNQEYISSLTEELKGKTYIYYEDSKYFWEYCVLEFGDAQKQRSYSIRPLYDDQFVDIRTIRANVGNWKETVFKVDFFSGDIRLGYQIFHYDKAADTITVGNDKFVLVSENNGKLIREMYKFLLAYESSDVHDETDPNQQTIEIIEGYGLFDPKEIQAEVYLDKAIDNLKGQTTYGFSVVDVLNRVAKNVTFDGFEYNEEERSYIYTYTCDYAPNKVDLPNYYVSGKLLIVYNIDRSQASLSGSVASAVNTYVALKRVS